MANVTWLHISDLHWRESQTYDANVVAQALLRDLANRTNIAPELARIDFIFITGDIAFASRPDEYTLARQFLDDLRSTSKVPKHRLFIVPGNHDIDRSAISDAAVRVVGALSNRQTVNRLLGDEVDRAVTMQRFHRYQQFINSYFKRYLPFDSVSYFYVKGRDLIGKRIAILGLNSTWASASDADRHNLFLGERQVRTALEQADDADIRIVLMHHPFDWLRDSDREDCEPLLMRACDFVLHGHLHRTGVLSRQAPGSEAMIIGAGACYETREYPNAYNLVHLDFDSGKGTIYLRMYSDHEGGFWIKDFLAYQDAPGQYTFDLPNKRLTSLPTGPTNDAVQDMEDWGTVLGTVEPSPATHHRQEIDHKKAGLAKWWGKRGYNSDPFIWPNAADINTELFPDVFQWWYIDPGMKADPKGLGPILTLEEVMRVETSEPVLIYASAGGGKTFYRRWAVQQIQENKQCAVEIWNIREKLRTPQNISAWVLAVCIYDAVCEGLQIPPYPSPPEDINHVFEQCDQTIRRYAQGSRCYVFIDDVAQLFGKRRSAAGRNARTLVAIVNLCTTVAGRSGGEPLALRIFIPEQLKEQIQRHLEKAHRRPREWTIAWSAEHCEAVIERRLDSCWKDGPGSGIDHLNRLFTDVARWEFNKWLRQQKGISPRCVIEVLDRLARYAYRRGVTTGLLDERLWAQFVKSGEPKGICTRDTRYPVSRPFLSWFKSLAGRSVALSFRLHQGHATRKRILPRLAGLLHGAIIWLASAKDWIEALLLLSILLGSILFVAWCLIQSAQLDQPPDLWACLQRIWQLIRQYLPGGS